jgi:hypothetical protein
MGAAVPWRYYYKWYGGKKQQIEAVGKSAEGDPDSKPACFLAQPINVLANKIKGNTDETQSFCDGSDCIDINDDKIAATQSNGQPYPKYLIMPFEGCGGDGKGNIPDLSNSCFGAPGLSSTQLISYLNDGNYADANTVPQCAGMYALWDNGKWDWNDNVKNNFLKYSMPLGVSKESEYGKKSGTQHLNWCSGQNMHFDIGMDTPLWEDLGMGNIAQTNAPSNIMMRYKRVPCDAYGKIDHTTLQGPNTGKSCDGKPTPCWSAWGGCCGPYTGSGKKMCDGKTCT